MKTDQSISILFKRLNEATRQRDTLLLKLSTDFRTYSPQVQPKHLYAHRSTLYSVCVCFVRSGLSSGPFTYGATYFGLCTCLDGYHCILQCPDTNQEQVHCTGCCPGLACPGPRARLR